MVARIQSTLLKYTPGFSLIETMVALGLAIIIIDLGYLITKSIYVNMNHWKAKQHWLRMTHKIQHQLYTDLISIQALQSLSRNELIFLNNNDKQVCILFEDRVLFRNHFPLNSDSLKLDFHFNYYVQFPPDSNQRGFKSTLSNSNHDGALTENLNHIRYLGYYLKILQPEQQSMMLTSIFCIRNRIYGATQVGRESMVK